VVPEAVDRGIRQGITLIALDDEKVVGMVGLGQEEGLWVMWKLYVLPQYQGKGVGKAWTGRSRLCRPEPSNSCWTY
jgi:ribosomal protein S18 acetylase RimI-like enzyme